MTPEQVLDMHRDVVAVNSTQIALGLSQLLRAKTLEEQRQYFGGSHAYGFTWLFRDDAKYPGKVMETVTSPHGDAITSIYLNHNCLATIGELARSRELLIKAVADQAGLSPDAVGVDDAGRGRPLGLAELATAQLIDLLAGRIGHSVITTGSVGGNAEIVGQLL